MLTIGLVYDLREDYLREGFTADEVAEFDETVTVLAQEETLRRLGYRPERIGNARELCRRLVAGDRWDLVFNVAEGVYGRSREAQVPALLELYGIPYTFSDPLVCAATLDKAVAKRLVHADGIPTPPFAVVRCEADLDGVALRYPLFVKPLAEGTGRGISEKSLVETPEALREACLDVLGDVQQPALVEEYLPGREFTVGILGTGKKARVIGTLEVRISAPEGRAIYSHHVKENWRGIVSYGPVPEPDLRAAVEDVALRAYRSLECRDVGRVDIRCDREGSPAFIEVNPLPGLNPGHSDLPWVARQEGMDFDALLGAIVESALERAGEFPERIGRMGCHSAAVQGGSDAR